MPASTREPLTNRVWEPPEMASEYVPYSGPIVTRAEAEAAGLKRYFDGTPCKRGHVSERTTLKHMCVTCKNAASLAAYYANPTPVRERKAAWKARNRARVNAAQTALRKLTKERDREWRRAWNKKNPERQIAASARYYADNAERLRSRARAWFAANPERASAQSKKWFAANPEMVRIYQANRRARINAAEGTHTPADIQRIGNAQRWKCHWCGKPTKRKYHVDHIMPLVLGGTNWPKNLAITCARCNQRKHASDPVAFAQREGRLI